MGCFMIQMMRKGNNGIEKQKVIYCNKSVKWCHVDIHTSKLGQPFYTKLKLLYDAKMMGNEHKREVLHAPHIREWTKKIINLCLTIGNNEVFWQRYIYPLLYPLIYPLISLYISTFYTLIYSLFPFIHPLHRPLPIPIHTMHIIHTIHTRPNADCIAGFRRVIPVRSCWENSIFINY